MYYYYSRIRLQQLETEVSSLRSAASQAESSRSFVEESWQRRFIDEQGRNQRALEDKERAHVTSVYTFEQEIRNLKFEMDSLRASNSLPIPFDANNAEVQVQYSIVQYI